MRFYADHPDRRFRQLLGDVVGVTVGIGAVPAGLALHAWLSSHAEPGDRLQNSADGLADNLLSAAETIGSVPLVGASAAEPLINAGNSASAMAAAGRSLQDFVGLTAVIASILFVVLALTFAITIWLLPRIAWVHQAGAARRARTDPEGLDILALRALTTVPTPVLEASGDGLLAAWRQGDPEVIRHLAQLELSRLGLFLPARSDTP